MIDLKRYFINPFTDESISLNRLIDFASTHLSRMVANNPGALLNVRITATTTVLTTLDTSMSDNDIKLALRKAKVQAKDAFRAALGDNITRIHAGVVAAFGPVAPQLTECFPQGRGIFGSCPDDQLDDKLQQLLTCLTPMAAQVGQIHVDNVGGLLSTWIALLAAVDTASANKTTVESARRNARGALQLELFKNLLTLAVSFPNDLEKAGLYCPQHLLEEGVSVPEPELAVISVATSSAAATAHLEFTAPGATSYRVVHKAPGAAEFTTLAEPESGSYDAGELVAGAHEFRVYGVNAGGEGPVSAVASVPVAAAAVA